MKLNREKILHETFRIGILMKGIDGALETIGAVLIWFLSPSLTQRILRLLFRPKLAHNPHGFLSNYLIGALQGLSANKLFASAFLLSHGMTKVVLVIALWFDYLWAYPLMILVLGAFVLYQTVRFAHTHSIVLGVLTLFDLLIVWLTWREYREQKRGRSSGRRLG
ncbi:MAG TPA: DUF2127 domain-containing protein [Candidatus Dormibacteraeota bacterium]|nr:DUF2127 domain-containing protein [Candidatus Dormibacteraeota bacterium]